MIRFESPSFISEIRADPTIQPVGISDRPLWDLEGGANDVDSASLMAVAGAASGNALVHSRQMASACTTELGPRRRGGGAAHRSFAFDKAYECMVLVSEATPSDR